MLEALDYQQSPIFLGHISQFESNKREPPLPVLLQYARIAGVALEALADDGLDLPKIRRASLSVKQC